MQQLISYEKSLHKVWFKTNLSVILQLLHPEFTEVDELGRRHHFTEFASLKDGVQRSDDSVHAQDYECIAIDNKTMLLLYNSAIVKASGEYTAFAKRSSIWVKLENQWKMRFHQGTGCLPFAIAEDEVT